MNEDVASSVTMDELRTRSGDVDFHHARRMFCIRNGKLTVAPEGTAMSHLEWFEAEGWVTKDNARDFMDSTVRGIFLPRRRPHAGVDRSFTRTPEEALIMPPLAHA